MYDSATAYLHNWHILEQGAQAVGTAQQCINSLRHPAREAAQGGRQQLLRGGSQQELLCCAPQGGV